MQARRNAVVVEAALDLARRGFAVFPCIPKGKTPATEHGFKDASTDLVVVEQLFAGRGDCNVGIATGEVSGFWALDLDGDEGIKAFDALQRQHDPLPKTVSQRTGGGGMQLFFRWDGIEVRNRTKIGGMSIDCRGTGGYVVCPPSIHPSGRRYEWEHDPGSTPLATAPDWLVEFVTGTGSTGKPAAPPFTGRGSIEDLAMAPGAQQGQRHDTALRLIGSAIGRGGDPVEVCRLAVGWGGRCTPPLPDVEVLKIVSDLTRRQFSKPAARKRPPTPPAPWKTFPVEALPEPVRRYVQRSAAAIGTDPAYVATALLPTLAAAIGTSRQILLKRGWIEPAVLWGVLVGESGTLKSPAIDAATRHVRKRQAEAVEVYRLAQDQYEKDHEAYKLAYEDWKKAGRKKGDPPPEEPEKTICVRFCCSDVTVEGLAVLLADAPRGLLLVRDELSGWIGSFDQYKTGHGADTAHWLTIHGARDLLVDRKCGDRKTVFVRRAAVSIVGGIQPGTLRRALGAEHFENGLAARLLLAMPPRRPKRWTEAEVDPILDQEIEMLLDRLHQVQHQADESGLPEPVTVGLSREGKAAWIEFYNDHAQRQADATGEEAAVLAKVEGAAARIALIVHLVRHAAGDRTARDQIDERSIASGVALARWYADEAARVYGVLAETEDGRLHRQVIELIHRRGGRVTANDLRRRSRQFATTEDAEQVLDGLVKAGIGVWETPEHGAAGGRPTKEFTLSNPVSVSETPEPPGNNEVSETAGDETGGNGALGWSEFAEFSGQPTGALVSETPLKPEGNEVSDTDTAQAGEKEELVNDLLVEAATDEGVSETLPGAGADAEWEEIVL